MNTPTWLITGTSNGMGLALSRLILRQGHRLVSISRRPTAHESLLSISTKETLSHIQLDLSNPDATYIKAQATQALNQFGTIDNLINMAGTTTFTSLEHLDPSTLQTIMQTNFYSPLYITQSLLAHFRETSTPTRKKVIVNVSSTQGLASDPSETAYDASKHALEAMTEVLAVEVSPFNIRTLLVEAGAFRTNFVSASSEHRESSATSTSSSDLGLKSPYDDPEHPVFKRMNMVAKYGVDGARGDPQKAAQVIFDVVMMHGEAGRVAMEGELSEAEMSLKPGLGGAGCERIVLGPDAWGKLKAKTDRLKEGVMRWENVSKGTDLDSWGK